MSGAPARTAAIPLILGLAAAARLAASRAVTPSAAALVLAAGLAGLLDPGTLLPWTLAATSASFLVLHRRPHVAQPIPPQLAIDQCRRRDEPAEVVVFGPVADLSCLRAIGMRTTDGVALVEGDRGRLVQAVLQNPAGGSRHTVEERIGASVGDAEVTFGWAHFPSDGVTLEALVSHAARQRSQRAAAPAEFEAGARAGRRGTSAGRVEAEVAG